MSHDSLDTTPPDLEDRRAEVLRAIVEEFVSSAQPVASQRVAARRGLQVSSATIRNDMHALERDGYIAQPHTSAGRIPTDQGYRYYVDHMVASARLAGAQQRVVRDFFDVAHRAMEEVLSQTSQLLARITNHAAVVVPPQAEAPTIRGIQVVDIGAGALLAVVVTSTGSVLRLPLSIRTTDSNVLTTASNRLAAALLGNALNGSSSISSTGETELDALCDAVIVALNTLQPHEASAELFVGGASRIANEAGFTDHSTVGQLLELLEHQYLVVSLAREVINEGVSVRIGAENEEVALRDCSLVLAPYRIDGRGTGTVAILGPTRMDYPEAIAAVDTVSRRLEHHLAT